MTTQQKPVWWEKTVEYAFVKRILADDIAACPLAGNTETGLGDLICKEGNEFRLIEFKRDITTIYREKKKYGTSCTDYLKACESIPNREKAAHWLVFGEYEESKLKLKFRHYHKPASAESDKYLEKIGSLETMSRDDFISYITELMKLRQTEEVGSAGGLAMISGDDQTMVLELNEVIENVPELKHALAAVPSNTDGDRNNTLRM